MKGIQVYMFICEESPLALLTKLQASGAVHPHEVTAELPLGHDLQWAIF